MCSLKEASLEWTGRDVGKMTDKQARGQGLRGRSCWRSWRACSEIRRREVAKERESGERRLGNDGLWRSELF